MRLPLPSATRIIGLHYVITDRLGDDMADKVHILMLEDSASAAHVAKKAISGAFANAEVTVVKDIASARQAADTKTFSAFTVDNGLPDGSGVDFIRELRKGDHGTANANAPVFFLSSAEQGVHDQARQASAGKPFGSGPKSADLSALTEFLAGNVPDMAGARGVPGRG